MNHGGKVALLGILPAEAAIDWNQVIFKGLILKGIYGREMFETWYKMVSLLQSGLKLEPIITHHLPVQEYSQAFNIMGSGRSGKVILDWKVSSMKRWIRARARPSAPRAKSAVFCPRLRHLRRRGTSLCLDAKFCRFMPSGSTRINGQLVVAAEAVRVEVPRHVEACQLPEIARHGVEAIRNLHQPERLRIRMEE